MTSPFPMAAAASWVNVSVIALSSSEQSPMEAVSSASGAQTPDAVPCPEHNFLIGSNWARPRPNWRTSRGMILPVAALEIILSRSPILLIWHWTSFSSSLSCVKWPTMSYLAFSSFKSSDGIASQPRKRREPIGEQHLSMTLTSDTPSPPADALKISRLRMVNLSIHTNLSSSMREIEQMLARPVCWVCSR